MITTSEKYFFELQSAFNVDKNAVHNLMMCRDEISDIDFITEVQNILGYCIYNV